MIAFFKILIVFAFILILLRRKVGIGQTMLAASLALGLLFQLPLEELAAVLGRALFNLASLDLVLSLMLILFLENTMRKTGLLPRMVQSVTTLARDRRIAMALLPAFIGLLPSVGGAIFSAPMVEEASQGLVVTAERKSFINYWYRHLWEYVLPLYPSLILSSQIFNAPIPTLILAQAPLTVAATLVGIPFAFRRVKGAQYALDSSSGQDAHFKDLIYGLSPILVVMVLVLALKVNVSISLCAALLGLFVVHRFTAKRILEVMREAFSWNTVIMCLSIVIFKEMIQSSGAIAVLPEFFSAAGIPVEAVIFALPFFVGLISGFNTAPVAVAFPVIAAVAAGQPTDPRMIAFAMASGVAGVMLSPAHMCLVLTVQHFRADFGRVVRLVAAPQAAVVLVGLAIYLSRPS